MSLAKRDTEEAKRIGLSACSHKRVSGAATDRVGNLASPPDGRSFMAHMRSLYIYTHSVLRKQCAPASLAAPLALEASLKRSVIHFWCHRSRRFLRAARVLTVRAFIVHYTCYRQVMPAACTKTRGLSVVTCTGHSSPLFKPPRGGAKWRACVSRRLASCERQRSQALVHEERHGAHAGKNQKVAFLE